MLGIEPTLEKNGDHPVAQFHRTVAVTPPPPKYVSWGEQLTGRMDACLVVRRQDIVHLGQPSLIAGYIMRTIAMAALTARSLMLALSIVLRRASRPRLALHNCHKPRQAIHAAQLLDNPIGLRSAPDAED